MLYIRARAFLPHGRRTRGHTRTISARHGRRRRSVSGRRFVNGRRCRLRSATHQEIGVVGSRKRHDPHRNDRLKAALAASTRQVRPAHPGNFQRLQPSSCGDSLSKRPRGLKQSQQPRETRADDAVKNTVTGHCRGFLDGAGGGYGPLEKSAARSCKNSSVGHSM